MDKAASFLRGLAKRITVVGDCHEWTGRYQSTTPIYRGRSVRQILCLQQGMDAPKHKSLKPTCGNPKCVNPAHLRRCVPHLPRPGIRACESCSTPVPPGSRRWCDDCAALAKDLIKWQKRPTWASAYKPKHLPRPTRTFVCKGCQLTVTLKTREEYRQFCTHACFSRSTRKPKPARICRLCPNPVAPKHKTFCTTCAAKARHHLTGETKARHLGLPRQRIHPILVFQRDHWKCHLCGRKLLQKHRGTYHPYAPEIDHIIPFAQRGGHLYSNVATACRSCNASKGGVTKGQLRLV